MNKQNSVEAVAAATDESKVTTGDTVQLTDSGAFSTGAKIQVPTAKTVKFTAGQAFKVAVNGA